MGLMFANNVLLQNCIGLMFADNGLLQNCIGLMFANNVLLQNCIGLMFANKGDIESSGKALRKDGGVFACRKCASTG